ncbi:MAG: UDP-glucose 4-epimerase [Coriobacteriaceae bacterium]|nr:UDP-glucose 4-epimerase [Coriobacteriaceae bacterium]
MRILVTGGAGFIGSNLVHALVGAHEVGVIDDLSCGSPENIHPASWFRTLDILDPSLGAVVAEFGPDAVIHLAAQASVTESIKDPARDRAVNVEGTRAVARAAAAAGARRLVSASSAAVYGEPAELPLAETSPKSPANPYGASKLAAESALADELAGTGADFASFRFSNVFGPRQDWRGEGGVVAIFTAAMSAGEPPTVFGDGKQTRDFIYVGDVVAACLEALLAEGRLADEGVDGPAYNVSTGRETSVDQLVAHLRAATGYGGPVDHAAAREGDVARSALDPAKARTGFGWAARSPLDSAIGATARWFAGRT